MHLEHWAAGIDFHPPHFSGTGLSARTPTRIRAALAGRGGPFAFLLFLGPAVIASIAYVDPGNYATNIQAGARYGFGLLWVVVVANLIAMLFQALSARLGIATGRNLAEVSRDAFPPALVYVMWAVSEVAAMATDLAEFLGGAIGLSLLLHVPLLWGMVITALVTYALLVLGGRGFRPMELVIGSLVVVISLCYLVELFIAPVDWSAAGRGLVVPTLPDTGALVIAVGIIGATIMPHAIFLHSGLTAERIPDATLAERRRLLHYSNIEVVGALGVAGLVNVAMVMMASAAFHHGHADVAELGTAYHSLVPLLGGLAAGAFLASLIASGVSSSVVGTMAGQLIMQGFVRRRVPIWVRRLATMAPAFVVVLLGVDTTQALVLSQVVLSISLPVPMLPLLWFVSRRDIMGEFAIGWPLRLLALAGAAIILALNLVLLLNLFGLPIPGFGR
ncbi:MAG TPA: Nramp family divalent metal transporter [Rhodanobacteraceae bacterium]|nr:Nramp family divalent metal transporter [Rhodanobacteraceae bacterium]